MTDAPQHAPLLQVRDLAISFATESGPVEAVTDFSLDIAQGETVAIVGESGSGKSTSAMAIIGLLPGNARVGAGSSILFDGAELVGAKESQLRSIRGASIGLVPQDPMSNLNPVSKIGTQVAETLLAHEMATRRDVDRKVIEVLASAGIPDPAQRAKQYPHELSGGLRQRALIAIGLACRPRLLIADEPTSALDVTVQRTILDQIERMTDEIGTSVLLITHDLGLAAERASRVVVMSRGRSVESGPAEQILTAPEHEYTKRLVAAAPSIAAVREQPHRHVGAPGEATDNIVEVKGLTKVFRRRGRAEDFVAADDVTISVPRGRTVAIVGESGSGKTTTARMLLRVVEPTSGSIIFDGNDVSGLSKAQLRDFRQRVQPIFQ